MFFSIILTGCLLIACLFDLKAFRIPNAVPLALIALFLVKAAAAGIAVWPDHVIGFGLTTAFGLLAFVLGMIGGGDAKLMMALALWFGVTALPGFLVVTAIGGGVLALTLLALRILVNRPRKAASSGKPTPSPGLLDRHAPVPYALPIAFAALWLEWQ